MRVIDFLEEDIGYGDITSEILIGEEFGQASIVVNEAGVLAGLQEAQEIFEELDLECKCLAHDGDRVHEGQRIIMLRGRLRSMLIGERLALNFIMRMSGIATETADILATLRQVNPNIRVAATRKTTPGFRRFEKRAVIIGGGDPHRYRLDDGILIKDNHIIVVGSVGQAVRMARRASFTKRIEVEVENMSQVRDAVEAGADIIMLDNMTIDQAQEAHGFIKGVDPRIIVEVSGGMLPDNAAGYAMYADVISMGHLTHSIKALHFSLHIEKVL